MTATTRSPITATTCSMLFAWLLLLRATTAQDSETCAWNDLSCYQDPHLKQIQVDLGTGTNETFLAYHPPDVSTFYQEAPGTREAKRPGFNGQFGKFINLSPNKVRIYWYVYISCFLIGSCFAMVCLLTRQLQPMEGEGSSINLAYALASHHISFS
jgi:hypothetical protein